MSTVISILLFFLVLYIFLRLHLKRWFKSQGVDHGRTAWIRAVCYIPSTIGFTIDHPGQFVWVAICAAAMQFFAFWILFDGWYNKQRGFEWWHTGGHNDPTEPDDSWLDQLQYWMGKNITQVIKLVGVSVPLIVYILSFLKLKFQWN